MSYLTNRIFNLARETNIFCWVPPLALIVVSLSAVLSQAQNDSDVLFTPEIVTVSLRDTLASLTSNYVYPEIARNVESEMLKRLSAGVYSEITTRSEFVSKISSALRELTNDGHMSVYATPNQNSEPTYVIEETIDRFKHNFGFESVRVLEGNIGYLKFNKFYENADARPIADGAFEFLQHTDALVIDLSENKGGSPVLVQYLLSYFLEEGALLWSIVDRNENTVFEANSLPGVSFMSFRQDIPVVIMITADTASAAEMFAYTLKHAGRAELVGQTTMGIAHLVGAGRINQYLNWRFSLSRPVNSVTNSSWEGIGVQPDIFAADTELLAVAHRRALELVNKATNSSR